MRAAALAPGAMVGSRARLRDKDRRIFLRALALAALLVGARIAALVTHQNPTFWMVWSAVVVVISFVSPTTGVALSLGNVVVSLTDESPLGASVGQLAGGAAAARMLLQFLSRRVSLKGAWRTNLLPLGGIAFVMMLSSFGSPGLGGLFSALRKLFLILLLYLVAYAYLDRPGKVRYIQAALVFAGAFAAAWTIGDAISRGGVARPEGLTGNPNYQGIYLAVTLPLGVGLVASTRAGWWRNLTVVASIATVLGIVATASRGATLAFIVAAACISWLWGGRNPRVRRVLLLFLGALAFGLSKADYAWKRIGGALQAVGQGTYVYSSRVRLTEASLTVWHHHPVLGVGVGNWLRGVRRYYGTPAALSPHVWPAQVLAEMGVLGAFAYAMLVVLCVQDYLRAIRALSRCSSPGVEVARAFLASALVMSSAWTSGNPYNQIWFMLLLMSGVCHRALLGSTGRWSTKRYAAWRPLPPRAVWVRRFPWVGEAPSRPSA